MKVIRQISAISLVLLLVLLSTFAGPIEVYSQGSPEAHGKESVLGTGEESREYFSDLEVVTQEGERLRFYSDLLKDRLVVISFFYTNCPTAQPTLITLFRTQKMLGERLGKDVLLLTISVDPEIDDQKAIHEFARNFNPQKGWLFLTGKPADMDVINRRLGNVLRLPEGHLRLFLIGNLKTGHWLKLPETAPARAVADAIRSLSSDE